MGLLATLALIILPIATGQQQSAPLNGTSMTSLLVVEPGRLHPDIRQIDDPSGGNGPSLDSGVPDLAQGFIRRRKPQSISDELAKPQSFRLTNGNLEDLQRAAAAGTFEMRTRTGVWISIDSSFITNDISWQSMSWIKDLREIKQVTNVSRTSNPRLFANLCNFIAPCFKNEKHAALKGSNNFGAFTVTPQVEVEVEWKSTKQNAMVTLSAGPSTYSQNTRMELPTRLPQAGERPSVPENQLGGMFLFQRYNEVNAYDLKNMLEVLETLAGYCKVALRAADSKTATSEVIPGFETGKQVSLADAPEPVRASLRSTLSMKMSKPLSEDQMKEIVVKPLRTRHGISVVQANGAGIIVYY